MTSKTVLTESTTAAAATTATKPLKFQARTSTMGKGKLVIYVPLEYHKELTKRWGKNRFKVTIEDLPPL